MKTFTANSAKQNFGELLDSVSSSPVSISKYNRPYAVVMSRGDYDELVNSKYEEFKKQALIGRDAAMNGDFSSLTVDDIYQEVISEF